MNAAKFVARVFFVASGFASFVLALNEGAASLGVWTAPTYEHWFLGAEFRARRARHVVGEYAMSDSLYADLIRSVIAELDRHAKTIGPASAVALICRPDGWRVVVECPFEQSHQFDGETPIGAIDQASAFLTEHDPDAVVRALLQPENA